MVARPASTLHALQCDLDLHHQEVESNAPSPDSGLAIVIFLFPVKWIWSHAVGFLCWVRRSVTAFAVDSWNPASCLPLFRSFPFWPWALWPGLVGCSEPHASECCCTRKFQEIIPKTSFLCAWYWLGLVMLRSDLAAAAAVMLSGQDASGWTESETRRSTPLILCTRPTVEKQTWGLCLESCPGALHLGPSSRRAAPWAVLSFWPVSCLFGEIMWVCIVRIVLTWWLGVTQSHSRFMMHLELRANEGPELWQSSEWGLELSSRLWLQCGLQPTAWES